MWLESSALSGTISVRRHDLLNGRSSPVTPDGVRWQQSLGSMLKSFCQDGGLWTNNLKFAQSPRHRQDPGIARHSPACRKQLWLPHCPTQHLAWLFSPSIYNLIRPSGSLDIPGCDSKPWSCSESQRHGEDIIEETVTPNSIFPGWWRFWDIG